LSGGNNAFRKGNITCDIRENDTTFGRFRSGKITDFLNSLFDLTL